MASPAGPAGHAFMLRRALVTVPDELAALPQWVVWKLEKRKGKTTKIPYRARDGRAASATDASDWSSFDEALEARDRLEMDGVGFVFTADDPYAGVDFDHCIDESGEMHSAVEAALDRIGSYAEVSPSGTGVHCIFKGSIGGSRRRSSDTDWGGNIEAYDTGRYFTFTGKSLNGDKIKQGTFSLGESTEGDDRIIRNCRRNSKGFAALFDDGDASEYPGDDGEPDLSRADFALANMLVARTQDPAQIERLMRRSALEREKWDHPDTGSTWLYRRCIEPALKDRGKKGSDGAGGGLWSMEYEQDVVTQMHMLEVREEARRRLKARDVPEDLGLPEGKWSLADELELPELEQVYRINELHPIGGNVLLIAAYKSGKTTLTLNLVRALADETPFLGKYDVAHFEGNICVVNYEETPTQWRRHARKLGIQNLDRVFPLHRRGQPILPVWEPKAQARLVDWMVEREIAYWIMDPTVVAWQGLVDNENDNALVAAFTTALDQVKEQAGIGELLLTHHEGRMESGRGRGATRLEDWMDAGWYLSRDEATTQRTIWAKGRDVELERTDLQWNEDRWMLSAGETMGEHLKQEKVEKEKELKRLVFEVVEVKGPITQGDLEKEVRAAGMKGDTRWMHRKFKEYAGGITKPGIAMTRSGSKITYSWAVLSGSNSQHTI